MQTTTRSPGREILLAAALAAVALANPAHAALMINGVEYVLVGSPEAVTAPFTSSAGGTTTSTYHHLVLIVVSGTGQSLGASFNDAFYHYIPDSPTHDPDYYQLVVTKSGSVALNHGDDAYRHIVYDVDAGVEVTSPYTPAYRADTRYQFVVDTATLAGASSSILRFGVNDGGYADNSGAYSIQVTQLEPVAVPAPSALLMAVTGVGLLGCLRRWRRKRKRSPRDM